MSHGVWNIIRMFRNSRKDIEISIFVISIVDTRSKYQTKILQSKEKEITTADFLWFEHLWNHEKMFETGVVRANEC